ncbi:MAG: H+-translocating transhydrogenase subunit alpha [Frankiales bacterium]|nr:H+-translocating transhydrogenase subunit alpha [Frankiales bacterium]
MKVAVVKESAPFERRVALVPDAVSKLTGAGWVVAVEPGAGQAAQYADADYISAGATVDKAALKNADAALSVQPLTPAQVGQLRKSAVAISFLQPAAASDTVRAHMKAGTTALSLDLLPRISRAQSMDALSSQALVSGYRCAILAAERLPKLFPLMMTAAGTIPPAKVLVMGAGVAGLQAIATARRLGAVVEAYDVRAAAAEEVRSLGATFVELELETQEGAGGYAKEQTEEFLTKQRELIGNRVELADVVITTAAIPGRTAPVLVTLDMVKRMKPGSIVIDLAAESGGNVEPSRPGEDVRVGSVTVIGARNMPSAMAVHASALYSRNCVNLLLLLTKDGALAPDYEDEIVVGAAVVKQGELVHGPTKEILGASTTTRRSPAKKAAATKSPATKSPAKQTPAKKTTATKSPAKKTPAKKTAARRAS